MFQVQWIATVFFQRPCWDMLRSSLALQAVYPDGSNLGVGFGSGATGTVLRLSPTMREWHGTTYVFPGRFCSFCIIWLVSFKADEEHNKLGTVYDTHEFTAWPTIPGSMNSPSWGTPCCNFYNSRFKARFVAATCRTASYCIVWWCNMCNVVKSWTSSIWRFWRWEKEVGVEKLGIFRSPRC